MKLYYIFYSLVCFNLYLYASEEAELYQAEGDSVEEVLLEKDDCDYEEEEGRCTTPLQSYLHELAPSTPNRDHVKSYKAAAQKASFSPMRESLKRMKDTPKRTKASCQRHALQLAIGTVVEGGVRSFADRLAAMHSGIEADFLPWHCALERAHRDETIMQVRHENTVKSLAAKREKLERLGAQVESVSGKTQRRLRKDIEKLEREIAELEDSASELDVPGKTSPTKFIRQVGSLASPDDLREVGFPSVAAEHIAEGHICMDPAWYADALINKNNGILSVIHQRADSGKLQGKRKSMFPQGRAITDLVSAIQRLNFDQEALFSAGSWFYGFSKDLQCLVGFRADIAIHVETAFPVLRYISVEELEKDDEVYIASRASLDGRDATYLACDDIIDTAERIRIYAQESQKIIASKVIDDHEIRLVDISDNYLELFKSSDCIEASEVDDAEVFSGAAKRKRKKGQSPVAHRAEECMVDRRKDGRKFKSRRRKEALFKTEVLEREARDDGKAGHAAKPLLASPILVEIVVPVDM